MDLTPLFEWFQGQAEIVIMAAVIVIGIVMAFRRQWIGLIASILVVSIIAIFVLMPETILGLAEWINGKLNIGNQ